MPLYYALNQAGRAIAAAKQPPGRPWQPHLHGLSIRAADDGSLQSTIISPQRTSDEKPGSFQVLAEAIAAPVLTHKTMLSNAWAAIPGLDKPGLGAGCPRPLQLEVVWGTDPPLVWLRHLDALAPDPSAVPILREFLERYYPQSGPGLVIHEITHDETRGMASAKAQVGWKYDDGTWRNPASVAHRYLGPSGLWLLPRLSSGDVLPPMLLWWCLLQALSSLARYHPAEWTAALDPDRSRWAVSIERTLAMALSIVPRLVLLTLSPGAIDL